MEVFKGSNLKEIIIELLTHMKTQAENPALVNSWSVFDRVLFLDVNFHQLNLTRGSSYLPLPDWIASKKAIINPQNEDDEDCFKWAVIAALHHEEIENNRQGISNLRRFEGSYDWRGLEFPIALNKIDIFEQKERHFLECLSNRRREGEALHSQKAKFANQSETANLLLMMRRSTMQRLGIWVDYSWLAIGMARE